MIGNNTHKEGYTVDKAAGNRGKGRKKGAVNRTTAALKEAILLAAEEHGEDDEGKDGLKGYLRKVAREDVKAFAALLGKVLPLTIGGNVGVTVTIERDDAGFL